MFKKFIFSRKLSSMLFLLFLLFVLFFGLNFYFVNIIRINGKDYKKIVKNHEFISDIVPPTLYLIEVYLDLHDILEASDKVTLLEKVKKIDTHEKEYYKTYNKYSKIGGFGEELERNNKVVLLFFKVYHDEFLYYIKSNKIAKAEEIYEKKLEVIFDSHKEIVEDISKLERMLIKEREEKSDKKVIKILIIMFVLFFVFCVLFYYIIKYFINEINKNYEEIERHNSILNSYIQNSPYGIFITDENGKYIDVNEKAVEITGYEKEELLNMGIAHITYEEDLPLAFAKFGQVKDGNKIEIELRFKKKSGEIRYWDLKSVKVNENTYLGFCYDITAKLEIEKEFRILTEERENIYKIIAHDLKGPIGNQYSLFKHVDINKLEIEVKDELLSEIAKTTHKIYLFLEELLDWSNLKSTIQLEEVNVKKIINETITLLEDIAKNKRVILNINISENYIINTDKNILKTVIRNILSNAIKFSYENSTVTTSINKENNNIIIKIADTGAGISKENLFLILNSPVKITTTGTNNEIGRGFGLKFCQDLIRRINGKIEISSAEQKGTEVYISIPEK